MLKLFGPRKISFDTFLSSDVTIVGAMTFTGDIRIEGQMVGDVKTYESTRGTVVIGRTGRVQGDVIASNAVVSGSIHGSVTASGVVGVSSTGNIHGDLTYDRLAVRENARIHGRLCRGSDVPLPAMQSFQPTEHDETEAMTRHAQRA